MSDNLSPLTFAYVRAHLLMSETELSDLKKDLAAFARTEGFTLRTIYVEQVESVPAAFQALMEAVRREDVKTVLVPSLHHLAVVGEPLAMKEHLEHHTSAKVLVARYAP